MTVRSSFLPNSNASPRTSAWRPWAIRRNGLRLAPWAAATLVLIVGCSGGNEEGEEDDSTDEDGSALNPDSFVQQPGDAVPTDFTQADFGGWKLGPSTSEPFPGLEDDGAGGAGGASGDEGCGSQITGIIRDMKASHPDFERDERGPMEGLVEEELGEDGKPVYAHEGPTFTTAGEEHFEQWYRDFDGINDPFYLTLHLLPRGPKIFSFESDAFFPLDDKGFGNEDNKHNYHFTFEIHSKFIYRGGETFEFSGDDDVWVFINERLAVDLGGVHARMTKKISLDEEAEKLEIETGNIYRFDMFHAERHTVKSNFRIDTTMEFTECGVTVR